MGGDHLVDLSKRPDINEAEVVEIWSAACRVRHGKHWIAMDCSSGRQNGGDDGRGVFRNQNGKCVT
jgi:hypothetical protein